MDIATLNIVLSASPYVEPQGFSWLALEFWVGFAPTGVSTLGVVFPLS
jgi:hypothetical protein